MKTANDISTEVFEALSLEIDSAVELFHPSKRIVIRRCMNANNTLDVWIGKSAIKNITFSVSSIEAFLKPELSTMVGFLELIEMVEHFA